MNKKILILGASSDIGYEVVKIFLKNNWNVVAHFNKNSKKLHNLKKEYNKNLILIKIDFKNIYNLKKNLTKNKKIFSKISSFVSLTGYVKKSSFKKIILKDLYDHLNVNFISNIFFINLLLGNMIKNKWGRILVSSSIGTKFGGGNGTYYYSLSKFMNEFIPGIFKKDYSKYIIYNALQIGVTNTKFHKKIPSKNLKSRAKLIPIRRIANTTEVAKKIFFLSSENNTLIHNQVINISGGE